jgi:MFS superfamily sulfate permease-like transporter
MGTMWTWRNYAPLAARRVPSSVPGVILGGLFAYWLSGHGVEVKCVSLGSPNLLDGVRLPTRDLLPLLGDHAVWWAALVIAALAGSETLFCARALDHLDHRPRTRYGRELFAQGVGNFLCGLFGALPMMGIMVRSSINAKAGAKTHRSAMMHGVWLLAALIVARPVISRLPLACLSGVLIMTSLRLIDLGAIRALWKENRREASVVLFTMAAYGLTGLLTGAVLGLAFAAMRQSWDFADLNVRVSRPQKLGPAAVWLTGAATFVSLPKLTGALQDLVGPFEVRFSTRRLLYIDHACLQSLRDWAAKVEKAGGRVEMKWDRLERIASGTLPMDEWRPVQVEDTVRFTG